MALRASQPSTSNSVGYLIPLPKTGFLFKACGGSGKNSYVLSMKLDYALIRQYGKLQLLARQMVEGFMTGLHKSPYHGFSVEFAEHKIYNPGEDTQHIDWKVFARTDRLYTKRYEEETNLRCRIMVDTSPSMYYPEPHNKKLVFSCTAAAALAYLMHRQRDAVGLATFSDVIEQETELKSSGLHLNKLYAFLENLIQSDRPAPKKTNVAESVHRMADKMKRRALIILFSDMFDNTNEEEELISALRHLKHNGHEVIVFHTYDHQTEKAFDFEDRPHLFIDVETGERVKARPSEIQQAYTSGIEAFFHNLKIKCGQFGIDFIEADINKEMHQVLLPYLNHRSRLY